MDMRTKKYDNVNNPRHYNKEGVECIDGIKSSMSEKEFLGYLKGNTIKYLWRYDYKEKPLEDLQKAKWYLDKMINIIHTNEEKNKQMTMDGFMEGDNYNV